jgi:hypothetical protein
MYRFQVEAYNFNLDAPGARSNITSVYACDVPYIEQKPIKVQATQSSISIKWNEPKDNGGCSIQGYSVHIDDGNQGPFVEANVEND